MVKNAQEFEKKLGAKIMEKIAKAKVEEWDISLLARLLLDDPRILKDQKDASNAAAEIRASRNDFVHNFLSQRDLSQPDFDKFWRSIITHLSTLADFSGPETKKFLESEKKKILSGGIDQKKESKFFVEAKRVSKELDGLKDAVGSIQKGIAAMAAERVVVLSTGTTTLSYKWHRDNRLGSGAQGSVYKATSKEDGTIIALKLAPHTTSQDHREYENLMGIKHHNVVRYIGHGVVEANGGKELAIGMVLVKGSSYDKYLEEHGPLKWDQASKDFSQLIDGMAAVHAKGIMHRDLKPANLMRKTDGRIVIVDFGLSKAQTSKGNAATVTCAGTFKGTYAYSAPEQHNEKLGAVSLATDVFAMAVIFYEAITGKLPFGASVDTIRSQRATVHSITNDTYQFRKNLVERPPVELTPDEAPPSLNRFLFKCLEKRPAERYKDAGDMKGAFESSLKAASDEAEADKETSRYTNSETNGKTAKEQLREKLQDAKELFEQELISADDYQKIKDELLGARS